MTKYTDELMSKIDENLDDAAKQRRKLGRALKKLINDSPEIVELDNSIVESEKEIEKYAERIYASCIEKLDKIYFARELATFNKSCFMEMTNNDLIDLRSLDIFTLNNNFALNFSKVAIDDKQEPSDLSFEDCIFMMNDVDYWTAFQNGAINAESELKEILINLENERKMASALLDRFSKKKFRYNKMGFKKDDKWPVRKTASKIQSINLDLDSYDDAIARLENILNSVKLAIENGKQFTEIYSSQDFTFYRNSKLIHKSRLTAKEEATKRITENSEAYKKIQGLKGNKYLFEMVRGVVNSIPLSELDPEQIFNLGVESTQPENQRGKNRALYKQIGEALKKSESGEDE